MEEKKVVGLQRHPNLAIVMNTPKGRGVFATQAIPAWTVVDISPVLILRPEVLQALSETQIDHYTFNWPYRDPRTGKEAPSQALALGLGSMFNHSRNQNVGFRRDIEGQTIVFTALREIAPQEELCISYGPRLWFENADQDEEMETETETDALSGFDLSEAPDAPESPPEYYAPSTPRYQEYPKDTWAAVDTQESLHEGRQRPGQYASKVGPPSI